MDLLLGQNRGSIQELDNGMKEGDECIEDGDKSLFRCLAGDLMAADERHTEDDGCVGRFRVVVPLSAAEIGNFGAGDPWEMRQQGQVEQVNDATEIKRRESSRSTCQELTTVRAAFLATQDADAILRAIGRVQSVTSPRINPPPGSPHKMRTRRSVNDQFTIHRTRQKKMQEITKIAVQEAEDAAEVARDINDKNESNSRDVIDLRGRFSREGEKSSDAGRLVLYGVNPPPNFTIPIGGGSAPASKCSSSTPVSRITLFALVSNSGGSFRAIASAVLPAGIQTPDLVATLPIGTVSSDCSITTGSNGASDISNVNVDTSGRSRSDAITLVAVASHSSRAVAILLLRRTRGHRDGNSRQEFTLDILKSFQLEPEECFPKGLELEFVATKVTNIKEADQQAGNEAAKEKSPESQSRTTARRRIETTPKTARLTVLCGSRRHSDGSSGGATKVGLAARGACGTKSKSSTQAMRPPISLSNATSALFDLSLLPIEFACTVVTDVRTTSATISTDHAMGNEKGHVNDPFCDRRGIDEAKAAPQEQFVSMGLEELAFFGASDERQYGRGGLRGAGKGSNAQTAGLLAGKSMPSMESGGALCSRTLPADLFLSAAGSSKSSADAKLVVHSISPALKSRYPPCSSDIDYLADRVCQRLEKSIDARMDAMAALVSGTAARVQRLEDCVLGGD
jgi:hypothetical protein